MATSVAHHLPPHVEYAAKEAAGYCKRSLYWQDDLPAGSEPKLWQDFTPEEQVKLLLQAVQMFLKVGRTIVNAEV